MSKNEMKVVMKGVLSLVIIGCAFALSLYLKGAFC